MKLTLPVSRYITSDNYSQITGIRALEYRQPGPILDYQKESLFHSNYGIIQKEFLNQFDSITEFLNDENITLFSFDLGPAAEQVVVRDYKYMCKSHPLNSRELKTLIAQRLEIIRQCFSGKIAMENLNYYDSSAYDLVCDASFIDEVIRENDTYFLLDLSHAAISALNQKSDVFEYLQQLPLDKVIQIHISGSAYNKEKGIYFDYHHLPSAMELEMLIFLKDKIPSEVYLTLEYYESFDKIKNYYELSLLSFASQSLT